MQQPRPRNGFAGLQLVVNDELEAREPVAWTWLLHSHNRIAQAGENAVAASNGAAEGRMKLFTSGELTLNLTDRFFSPAINWKKRTGPAGRVQEYVNHWQAEFPTAAKSRAQRFLAVFRITPEGRKPLALKGGAKGHVTVGGWSVSAELDASKPASLSVTDRRGNAVLYNTPASETAGSTVVRRRGEPARELVDVVPASVR